MLRRVHGISTLNKFTEFQETWHKNHPVEKNYNALQSISLNQ